MPSPEEMAAEKERLYESSSLRDDLNDAEASVLLNWGEGQVERLANTFPEEFEAKARFLRQLIKNINRFVGQREFNEMDGQAKYMSKIIMYLEPLGWVDISSEDLFAVLPDNKADMSGNLDAILGILSPATQSSDDAPINDTPRPLDETEIDPASIVEIKKAVKDYQQELENSNPHSITQHEDDYYLGDEDDYGED